jgi:hypothetical protein
MGGLKLAKSSLAMATHTGVKNQTIDMVTLSKLEILWPVVVIRNCHFPKAQIPLLWQAE